jgi:hypothetical protein
MSKIRMLRLSTISSVLFVCFTGYIFFASWLRHARGTVGSGIIFVLALGLAVIPPFIPGKKK